MELKKEFPYLKNFVTLSPAPMFSKWLKEKDIKLKRKLINSSSIKKNESEILAYAKEYFFKAKQNDNYPIDPVQRFHLSNGAILENIHLNADLSENGIKNSLSLMVNYKYELASIEKNHEEYFSKMSIPSSKKLKWINYKSSLNKSKITNRHVYDELKMRRYHKINLNRVSYRRDYKKQSSVYVVNRFHLRITQCR